MRGLAKTGFTLFEVLVALGIIAIISGAGLYSLGRGEDRRALNKAARSMHAMIRVARTQAITNGVHSRLIINYDPSDRQSCLRQIGVVVEDPNAGKDRWRAVERGTMLPQGVFVVPWSGDAVSFSEDWTSQERRSWYRIDQNEAENSAVFKYDYPLKAAVPEGQGQDWIVYQFAPNGRVSPAQWGGGDHQPANRIVLANAGWDADKIAFRTPERLIAISFKLSGASIQNELTELEEME
ncbi:type II secretion system protein [Pelagicoccus sp. SDUM812003]|uniref:pilus assembly FimT family protein n=1 Tax=Pelagicoccus sp. SDUM812003 TaxID=3041267 RepID=UPI00280FDECF|nr:type II secretion system protein [Pelagicoccus sp. SDUM812003]MDQ8204568.1 type II secretion system protein [Pelagicoccus sp. SDUM812003]